MPDETDQIIESIATATSASAQGVELRRRAGEVVSQLRAIMTDQQIGGYFGIFSANVHQSLLVTRQTIEQSLPILAAYPSHVAQNLLNSVVQFSTDIANAAKTPQAPEIMDALLRSSEVVARTFSEPALLGKVVRVGYDSAKHAALGVVNQQEQSAAQIRQLVDATASQLRAVADQLIREVSAQGTESVARAKKEVRDVLLENAKSQFGRAAVSLWVQSCFWAACASIALYAFFAYALRVVAEQHLPNLWTWQIAYYTAIRVIILGGIGAAASFFLRMLKSHLNLVHVNAHRNRVVHSVADFVAAAPAEHQYEVFKTLLDTVVSPEDVGIRDDNPEAVTTNMLQLLERLSARGKGE